LDVICNTKTETVNITNLTKVFKFLIKYLTLGFFSFLLFKITKFYDDFCSTVYNIFIVPTLIIIIILNIIIVYIVDYRNKKFKLTNYVVIFLFLFFGIHLLKNYLKANKEIEKTLYVSPNFNTGVKGYEIKLYKDNSYEINSYWQHGSCHYFGDYELKNNKLFFLDKNISKKTNNQIGENYQFNSSKKEFESLRDQYPNIKFRIE